MIEFRFLRPGEHEPDTAAIEERQFAGAEEEWRFAQGPKSQASGRRCLIQAAVASNSKIQGNSPRHGFKE